MGEKPVHFVAQGSLWVLAFCGLLLLGALAVSFLGTSSMGPGGALTDLHARNFTLLGTFTSVLFWFALCALSGFVWVRTFSSSLSPSGFLTLSAAFSLSALSLIFVLLEKMVLFESVPVHTLTLGLAMASLLVLMLLGFLLLILREIIFAFRS